VASLRRVAPIFAVRDLAASMAYYQRLGFAVRAWVRGAYLFVDDADELAREWRAAGAEVHGPEDTEWHQHEGALVDPDGNVIRFGSPVSDAAPSK